jgi:hypothetical protein
MNLQFLEMPRRLSVNAWSGRSLRWLKALGSRTASILQSAQGPESATETFDRPQQRHISEVRRTRIWKLHANWCERACR